MTALVLALNSLQPFPAIAACVLFICIAYVAGVFIKKFFDWIEI